MGRYYSYDPTAVAITGGSIVGITDLAVADGGTASSTAANARTALGAKYDNVSATDKVLGRSTAGAGVIEEIACTSAGRALIDDADAAAQRTTLGLGTIATQAANSVSITGGSVTGTDVTATDLKSASTTIAIDAATAPSAGQVLTASSSTVAAWATPGGAGDVVGPASATDNAIARFDTTTGKLIQNSGVTIDDSANIATTGTVDGVDVSGIPTTYLPLTGGALVGDVTSTANIQLIGNLKYLILDQIGGSTGIKIGMSPYIEAYLMQYGTTGQTYAICVHNTSYILFPVQAPTASAPVYVIGGVYFDTTLAKLRVGGATGWETITSS